MSRRLRVELRQEPNLGPCPWLHNSKPCLVLERCAPKARVGPEGENRIFQRTEVTMVSDNHDHGPIMPRRIPAAEFDRDHGPMKDNEVFDVNENWTIDQLRTLPPSVKYLRYPNGDVQRL